MNQSVSKSVSEFTQYNFIDSNKLNTIIGQILSSQVPIEIVTFGNRIHPRTNKSNYDEHFEQIYNYIDNMISSIIEPGKTKSYILSSIKHGDVNIIDINLYIHKNYKNEKDEYKKDDFDFYFVGVDLVKYLKFLPSFKVILNGRIQFINSKKGTNHSRWYPILLNVIYCYILL